MPTDDDILTQRMLGTGRNYEPVPELPAEDEEALEATTEIPKEAGVFLAYPMRELMKASANEAERQQAAVVGQVADDIQDRSLDIMLEMEELRSERQKISESVVTPEQDRWQSREARRVREIEGELKSLQEKLDAETTKATRGKGLRSIPSLTDSPEGRGAIEAALTNMEAPGPIGVPQADYALADEMIRQSMGDDAYRAYRDVAQQTLDLRAHKGLSSQKLSIELEELARTMLESRESEVRVQQMEGARFMAGDSADKMIDALKRQRTSEGYKSVRNMAEAFETTMRENWPGGVENMPEELSSRLKDGVERIVKQSNDAAELVLSDASKAESAATKALQELNELMRHVNEQAGKSAQAWADAAMPPRSPAARPRNLVQMAQEAMESGTLRTAGGATAEEIIDAWERAQALPAAGIADIPPQQLSRADLHGAIANDLLGETLGADIATPYVREEWARRADVEAFLNTQGQEGNLPPGVTMEKIKGSIRKILNDPPIWLEKFTTDDGFSYFWNGSEWVDNLDPAKVDMTWTGDTFADVVLGENQQAGSGLGSYYDEIGTKGRPPAAPSSASPIVDRPPTPGDIPIAAPLPTPKPITGGATPMSLVSGAARTAGRALAHGVKMTPLDWAFEAMPTRIGFAGWGPPLMQAAGEPYEVYEERRLEQEARSKARLAEEEFWRTHTVDLNQMSPAERTRYDAWQKREAETEDLLQEYLFSPDLGPGSRRPSYLPYLDED